MKTANQRSRIAANHGMIRQEGFDYINRLRKLAHSKHLAYNGGLNIRDSFGNIQKFETRNEVENFLKTA